MPVLWIYCLELMAVLITGLAATLAGFILAARGRALAFVAASAGLLLFLTTTGAYLFPQLYFLPQPLPITEELLQAGGMLLLGASLRRTTTHSTGRILTAVLAIFASFYVLHEPASRLVVGSRFASFHNIPTPHTLKQSTPQTCVPACCAALLGSLGLPFREGDMAVLCRASWFGASWADAIRALREAGRRRGVSISCSLRTGLDAQDLTDIETPGILPVEVAGRGHAILFLEAKDSPFLKIRIADPLEGRPRWILPEELSHEYEWNGRLLSARRVHD